MKWAKGKFGDATFLVSKEKFKEICKKYDLTIGVLSDYNGVIPHKNVEEVAKVVNSIKESNTNYIMVGGKNHVNLLNNFGCRNCIFVTKIETRSPEDENKVINYIFNNERIVGVKQFEKRYDKTWWGKDIIGMGSLRYDALTKIDGVIIDNATMFIACPEKYLNNPKVEISRHPVDPIVFQYCPYGVLVHSVWGEEAEDETLKQYFEINNRILNS